MSLSDPRWEQLTDSEWEAFALTWIAELSGQDPPPLPDLPDPFPDDPITTASDFVVPMNALASAESQWRFIQAVFRLGDDETMGHLAAGPVEHLLSKHGDEYIERFEAIAQSNPRFAEMLTTCHKHMMSDEVWDRIRRVRGDISR